MDAAPAVCDWDWKGSGHLGKTCHMPARLWRVLACHAGIERVSL